MLLNTIINTRTVRTTRYDIDKKSAQHYGGYVTYFRLYIKLWKMMLESSVVADLPRLRKIWAYVDLCLRFFWYCLVKPLACIYSHVTYIKGWFTVDGEGYVSHRLTLSKCVTHRVFGIPVLSIKKHVTQEDIQEITKNKQK